MSDEMLLDIIAFQRTLTSPGRIKTIFEVKSKMKIRGTLSEIFDKTGKIFEEISKRRELDFRCEKHNRH